jgi:hypothetical protein
MPPATTPAPPWGSRTPPSTAGTTPPIPRPSPSGILVALVSGPRCWPAGGAPAPLSVGLLVWQGTVYVSAPFMAWLSLHTRLSAQLERRRRTERQRERAAQAGPYVGAAAGLAAARGCSPR